MLVMLARVLIARLLSDPEIKQAIMLELTDKAKRTETKLDDNAVAVFDEIWSVVVPGLLGKL